MRMRIYTVSSSPAMEPGAVSFQSTSDPVVVRFEPQFSVAVHGEPALLQTFANPCSLEHLLESSVPSTPTVSPSALVHNRMVGCVRTGAGPEVIAVPGTFLTAQVAGLAGRPSPAHQQGRLVHLAVSERRCGTGRCDDGDQAEDAGASHGHAHCSLGDHGATAPARTILKTRCPLARFASPVRGVVPAPNLTCDCRDQHSR